MKIVEDVWVPAICGRCYGNCGIKVRRVNGVAVKIEGIPESDMGARGGICGKGIAGLQVLYDPNRLNVPLRRTNPEKGLYVDPGWKEISWEEALDEIAAKLGKILKENPRKLLCQWSVLRSFAASFCFRPFYALGVTDMWVGGGGLHCGAGAHASAGMAFSSWSIVPDFEHTKYVLYFGSSKGVGSGHSAMIAARKAADARARGARFVAFDPMCNFSGGKATEWIPIIPGTDGAVVLAICNIIVNKLGVYDSVFLKTKTNAPYLIGWDGRYVRDKETERCLVWDNTEGRAVPYDYRSIPDYKTACQIDYALEGEYEVNGAKCWPAFQLIKEHLKKYTPEVVSKISTVPAETISTLATEFAEAAQIGSTITIQGKELPYRPVSAVLFRGGEGHENSFQTCFAVAMLSLIVGAADVPGGTLGWPARSLGHPETGAFRFSPYKGRDGLLETNFFGPAALHVGRRISEVSNKYDGLDGRTARETIYDQNDNIIVQAGSVIGREAALRIARLPHRIIKVEPFVSAGPWPPHDVAFEENAASNKQHALLKDLFPLGFDPGVAGSSDQEMIWQKINLPYRWEMLLSWGCNTPMSVGSWDAIADSLKRIPFIVVSELFNTELTAGFADIVLPDASYLENLTWWEGRGQNFNYPFGMDDWCYHVAMPVVPPRAQRRHFIEIVWELLDRLGYREKLNESINDFVDFDDKSKLKPDERFTQVELANKALKYLFGPEKGLDYFEDEGFVRWPKKVEEAYWRYSIDCRVPIYLEFLIDMKEKMQKITDKIGLDVDYAQYTPLLSWFPCSIHQEKNPEFDLYCFSYRDIIHTSSSTMEQPWIDEVSRINPYTYNITMNWDTGIRKGLKDGDIIEIETPAGRKVAGTLKLMEGQHPQTIGIAACSGHWAKGQPIAKGKGTNFDNLLELDLKHSDPISLNIETAVRVKVKKLVRGSHV
ncbi:molybdopterin-dependent oxidoreductase [Chloroflexota bacterium]